MKHQDKIEKQEFKYPMWFKSKLTGNVSEFSSLNEVSCIYLHPKNSDSPIPHTDKICWEQVEYPKKDLKK